MPSGELRLKRVMTNPSNFVSRIRRLGVKYARHVKVRNRHFSAACVAITCSGGQLKRGFCVVLSPILQGALHIRSVIQQQLWRGGMGVGEGERWGRKQSRRRESR